MEALRFGKSRAPFIRSPSTPLRTGSVEGRKSAVLACAFLLLSACTAGTPTCADGVDRGLKTTDSTCGPYATVTVKSGSSCVPSAFTGFNSELAGFPAATNDDHPIEAVLTVSDSGTELRRCVLAAVGDAGFRVTCDRCQAAADAGSSDAGCTKLGSCVVTLLP